MMFPCFLLQKPFEYFILLLTEIHTQVSNFTNSGVYFCCTFHHTVGLLTDLISISRSFETHSYMYSIHANTLPQCNPLGSYSVEAHTDFVPPGLQLHWTISGALYFM